MTTKAREAFWNIALGNNSKLANLAKLAIKEAEDEAQQRTWVGLTDEEMKKTWYEMQNIMGWYSFQEIANAIQEKLKEKNNA